jgi:hypothetical protein
MARDELTGGLNFSQGIELFAGVNLSGPKNKPKKERRSYQEPKIYQPLARAASLISASINTAERNTARAVTRLASIEPTGQLEEVLQPLATLILGAVPDQKAGPELENIARAVFEARRGFLTAEKAALRIAELLPKEVPIRAIADGRMDIINDGIDLSLTSPGPFTPEDVVRIGMTSLQDAGRKIKAALQLLESSVPTNEISPILRALIDAISPKAGEELSLINKGSSGLSSTQEKPVFVPYTTPTKGGTILAMQNIPPSLLNNQIQLSLDFQKSRNSDPLAGTMPVNCSDREKLFSSDYGSLYDAVEALNKEPRKGDLLLLKNFFQLGESDRQKVLTIVDYFLNGDRSLRSNGRNESNAGLVLVS